MLALKAFLSDRLAAAAEEIYGAVEQTVAEYKDELCRSKDLEISRLRMQIKILKSVPDRCGAQLQHHHPPPPPPPPQLLHQSNPVMDEHCAEEEGEEEEEEGEQKHRVQVEEEDLAEEEEEEHPESSQVKKEHPRSHFWMVHDEEQLEELDPDIKDFMSSSPAALKASSLQDPSSLAFHHHHHFHHLHHQQHNGAEEARDKPYSCSVCEKRFSNCSHLAAHIRTHTGERPYRCEICRKSFITTSALNRHQTIHTEGKPFVCNYCGKSFKWMESLGRHVRSVHRRDNATLSPSKDPPAIQ